MLAQDDEYDIALCYLSQAASSADGSFYNIYDIPNLDLERGYCDQNILRDLTINGKLYLINGDISDLNGDKLVFTGDSERALKLYETLQSMLGNQNLSLDWSKLKESTAARISALIGNKQILFRNMVLSFVRRNYRDIDIDFGLLPLPKLDETQEHYTTMVNLSTPTTRSAWSRSTLATRSRSR